MLAAENLFAYDNNEKKTLTHTASNTETEMAVELNVRANLTEDIE